MTAAFRISGARATALGLLGSFIVATSVAAAATELPPPGVGTRVVPQCSAKHLRATLISGDAAAPAMPATFGLTNRGTTVCRLAGNVALQLLDEHGKPYAVRMAVRTTMAMLLALQPGRTASFTAVYTGPAAGCPASAAVAVIVPGALPPARLVVPARVAACTGSAAPSLRVSDLAAGVVPQPLASGAPSRTPVNVSPVPGQPLFTPAASTDPSTSPRR